MGAVFGDYTSFLELAFGVNFLFGVWTALYRRLYAWQVAISRKFGRQFRVLAADRGGEVREIIRIRQQRSRRWCSQIQRRGRWFSIFIAPPILLALLYFPDAHPVNFLGIWLIILSISPIPIVALMMCAVTFAVEVWNWGSFRDMIKNPEVISAISKTKQIVQEEQPPEDEEKPSDD